MSSARLVLVLVAVTAFVGIGVIAILQHDYRVGVASLLLAVINGLLLS